MFYIVATPIGNLKDITFRAVEILKKVDYIACEDTRKSIVLLNHYEIKKPLISFHEYNEEKAGSKIISLLLDDKSVALISDAGTPVISDPGHSIIQKVIDNNIDYTIIPGASAGINALVLSGLPSHSFIFRGFPPHKSGRRKRFLQENSQSSYTLIYYESPYRIEKFLTDALEVFGDRQCAIINDLTKKYETIIRGTISENIEKIKNNKIRGEYVIVIEGLGKKDKKERNKEESN